MTIHEKIIKIRVDLQNSKLKKSGKNQHAKFDYYELSDFLPKLNALMLEYKINDQMSIEGGLATLALHNAENLEESVYYSIPFESFAVPTTKSGSPMMQHIQYLGALNTYYKRYLYLNAFGITDGEVIDSMDNSQLSKEESDDLYREKLLRLYDEKRGRLDDKLKERVEQIIVTEETSAYSKTIKHLEKL